MDKCNLVELLDYIHPAELDYQEWVSVGMALKDEGYTAADWDAWSKKDAARYRAGECYKKWASFRGAGSTPVTGATVVQMAKDRGWRPEREPGHELDWDAIIGAKDDQVIVNPSWVERRDIEEPENWNPAEQLVKYLEILFESTENVGYVTETWNQDGKHMPKKGCWDRTAGELIDLLKVCDGDVGSVIGDCNPEVGAWIRFNPLDGKGIRNENVTDFRYALVESDAMELEQQHAIIRELELPVACMVHSGGKSIHAIVRIDAPNYDEYRRRVDYLYQVCKKNGLKVDSQNRNPSRLSRMPGIMRGEKKQFLIDTNIGKADWTTWQTWIESVNDDLPDPESMDSVWDNLPELAQPLIDGVLRQGHKMLVAGPSKAGKSFSLIELTVAIAEGRTWLGWSCAKGRVLYVNLELDRASCLHRFKDVYQALGWRADNLRNIDIWNLRGKSVPMDKLAPKLIRRAAKKNYIAVIIDPIYKVITGDENSADQMAAFCNQFDLVCHELNAAVIYCHHHSKGTQGQKRSMDRASGSGVFARDPDAMLDLIELELTDAVTAQEVNKAVCSASISVLNKVYPDWEQHIGQDDMLSQAALNEHCKRMLTSDQYKQILQPALFAAERTAKAKTAWRVEGTLREYPKFAPVDLWFDYPVHHVDRVGCLADISAGGEAGGAPWKRAQAGRKGPDAKRKERMTALNNAFEACKMNGEITVTDLAEYLGTTEKTVRNRIKEHGGYDISDNSVLKRNDASGKKTANP